MLNDFFNNKTTLQPLLNSKTWKKMSYCENKTKTLQTDRTNIENREKTQRFGSCENKIKQWKHCKQRSKGLFKFRKKTNVKNQTKNYTNQLYTFNDCYMWNKKLLTQPVVASMMQ